MSTIRSRERPSAGQCLAMRVVLAPYDVQRARPFKARHTQAGQVVPPQVVHLQQRQLIHPQASDRHHESSSRGSAMTFGSVLRPPLARRSTPSQLMRRRCENTIAAMHPCDKIPSMCRQESCSQCDPDLIASYKHRAGESRLLRECASRCANVCKLLTVSLT